VLAATHQLMRAFALLMRRHEEGSPVRCPRCNSYQVVEGSYAPRRRARRPWSFTTLATPSVRLQPLRNGALAAVLCAEHPFSLPRAVGSPFRTTICRSRHSAGPALTR
jgi:hypothetical protein